jgi:hypothetical protein
VLLPPLLPPQLLLLQTAWTMWRVWLQWFFGAATVMASVAAAAVE